MSDNDILEMESLSEAEDLEGDTDVGMIDEEVGEREKALPYLSQEICCLASDFVWYHWALSGFDSSCPCEL